MYYLRFLTLIGVISVIDCNGELDTDCNGVEKQTQTKSFNTSFYLKTPENGYPTTLKQSERIEDNLVEGGFNKNRSTIVILHGFLDSVKSAWIADLTKKLIQKEPVNVILVDWSSAYERSTNKEHFEMSLREIIDAYSSNDTSKRSKYVNAILSTKKVASDISNVVKNIATVTKTPLSNWPYLHFIGHGLGAHIVGQAARLLSDQVVVHRITGLDPALLNIGCPGDSITLKESDAVFVDVIHTNSVKNNTGTLGTYQRLGHIDFYPNLGNDQPRCNFSNANETMRQVSNRARSLSHPLDREDAAEFISILRKKGFQETCNHLMAPVYFIESLDNEYDSRFWAVRIDPLREEPLDELNFKNRICNHDPIDCIRMGIDAKSYQSKNGRYFVKGS